MKQKLLITGGSGFVAFHIIEAAIQQDYEVYISIRPSSSTAHLKGLDIKYLSFNFADKNSLIKELQAGQFDYIIHAAGTTRADNQQEYDRVNATFSVNLAEAALASNIPLKKFVFVSSLAAIGPSDEENMLQDNSEMKPVTGYGRSKKLAESLLNNIPGLPIITFRPTAVYGPREKDILIILKTIASGFEPYIGSKPQSLSFIYVKDLAKLLIDALQSTVINKAYNISDGNIYDRLALAGFTREIIGKKTFRIYLPVPVVKMLAGILETTGRFNKKTPALNREKINELTASWICNIEAAKRDLQFMPGYDLKAGLHETLQWYKQHKWL